MESPRRKTFIKSLDSKIQGFFDKIFSDNLTVRYVLGLAIIGLFSFAGHLIIQVSLVKLASDERTIRVLQNQVVSSEMFYREIIRLQIIAHEGEFKRQVETIDKDIVGLIEGHKSIMARLNRKRSFGLGFPRKLEPMKKSVSDSFDQLSNVFGKLGNIKYLSDPTLRLDDPIVIEFIKSENQYRDILSQLRKSYEDDSRETIQHFSRLEVMLLFSTLFILLFEGLYVFRPAVERVYAAIQSRTDFLGRLSHEIRNPMNSILGMTQLLSKTKLSQQQANYIKILENSSSGLLEMLNNLLDYTALESSKLNLEIIDTDIYNIIERAFDLVTTKIQEKGLELILYIAPNVPVYIKSDPMRLQQVLVNLLSNSAKFTERGAIELRVTRVDTGDGPKIRFDVIDTGVGIDPAKIETVFESFVQENSSVRRKFGGTGLGLAIAKEIVDLMDGNISVTSKKDHGSTFTFEIPVNVSGQEKTLKDYIQSRLTGMNFLLIDRDVYSGQSAKNIIEEYEGQVTWIKETGSFDEIYGLMTEKDYSKILLDASTLATSLEAFLEYLKERKFDMGKISVLFRYVHANYLFELLTSYDIENSFPKPIRPVELINYLGGHATNGLAIKTDEKEVDAPLYAKRKYKVLIAEDSADNRMLLQIYLSKYPLDLYFAENGARAVELFNLQKFDMILMDIQMPHMDGITATKLIRKKEKAQKLESIPILAFSAHKPQEIFQSNERSYFTDFVLKPINSRTIRTKLRQYLEFSEDEEDAELPYVEREADSEKETKKEEFDVSDLIPLYLERRSKEVEEMQNYLGKKDFKNLSRIGHQLKGSAKSYGFEELGRLGDQLERKTKNNSELDEVRDIVTEITNKIEDYRKLYL